jgi:anti-sigma B factor antagonist
MKISREDIGRRVVVLRLEGELLGGPEVDPIIEVVRRAVDDGRHYVLMDLKKVPWMSSGGVGILTRVHTTLKQRAGKLTLLHPSDRIKRILMVTGLIVIFECFEDEKEALASFAD